MAACHVTVRALQVKKFEQAHKLCLGLKAETVEPRQGGLRSALAAVLEAIAKAADSTAECGGRPLQAAGSRSQAQALH